MFVRFIAAAATTAALVTLALPLTGSAAAEDAGALFALTNSPAGNAVAAFARAGDGTLTPAGFYATGGTGTGSGLFSQNAVIVSDDQRWLFAVNSGSNSISAFRVHPGGLELIATAPSGGSMPTSVAYRSGLLYVLNAGVPNNVSGFTVSARGAITPLPGSARPLSGSATGPAQVAFSDDGATLIVTERATNLIDTFRVDDDGYLSAHSVFPSAGPTPFGFAVDKRNTLLVSEAGAGGGASSYRIDEAGSLEVITGMVMTGQRAACWAVITPNGRFGYVSNAGTGTITGFALDQHGSVVQLDADGVTTATGGNPTDMALARNGRFLYARVGALGQIAGFRIESDGSLQPLAPVAGVPGTYAGLAGF